jgi:hypothetical protein
LGSFWGLDYDDLLSALAESDSDGRPLAELCLVSFLLVCNHDPPEADLGRLLGGPPTELTRMQSAFHEVALRARPTASRSAPVPSHPAPPRPP